MPTRMSWWDLRFTSWDDEEAFKKKLEEKLIYSALAISGVWHTLLLVPSLWHSHFGLVHIVLLSSACLLGAVALLRLCARWFRSFNWELIFIVSGCSSMLAYPFIKDDYLNNMPEFVGKVKYFENLAALLGITHAIAIPFRSSFSWVLLFSDFVACLIALWLLGAPEASLDVLNPGMFFGLCVLCWCTGRRLEEKTRREWQANRQLSSKLRLSSVLPQEDTDDTIDNDEAAASDSALKRRHPLRIGSRIPDFQLKTTDGDFSLSEFLRRDPASPWTVLFSHPADFTPACTTEMGACHQLVPKFAAAGIKMIGLSCDSLAQHQKWSKDVLAANKGESSDGKLPFPIIADEDKTICTALGLFDPNEKDSSGKPLPARALVLLYNSTVQLTSLYPASCGRNFENVGWIISALKPFHHMGISLPAAQNPLQLCATIPDFQMKTTKGTFMMHEWLTRNGENKWTLFFSACRDMLDSDSWGDLLEAAKTLDCKIIGIAPNDLAGSAFANYDFPVILDNDRQISTMLDIIDTDTKDAAGFPQLVCTLIVLLGKTVKMSEIYRASVSRNFSEVARILSSFRVTGNNSGLVTPANWKKGAPVLLHPTISTKEAQERYATEVRTTQLPSGKEYLRHMDCPE